ncbi:Uncharacterised protein [Staphylococcus aureus]|nr:Uncharacterised protein [Staphylococcus aureus]
MTASVPEFTKRIFSRDGIASRNFLLNSISNSVGVPNKTPLAACS